MWQRPHFALRAFFSTGNAVDTVALRIDDVSGLVSHDLHISGLVNQQQSQHRCAKQRTVHSQIVHHVSGLIMPGQFPHP
jgi:hypothetical protein